MRLHKASVLSNRQFLLLVLPLAAILILFLLLPLVLGFVATFTNYAPFQTTIRFVGLGNYRNVLQDGAFQAAVRNVVYFTGGSVSVELALGFLLAFALRKPFRGRSLIRFGLLLPWLVSPVAAGIMWHFLLNTTQGLLNYFPALFGLSELPYPLTIETAMLTVIATEVWRKTPFVTFLFLPGFISIPAEQWDQARVDGLGLLHQMRHVVFPALRVLLLTVMLLLIGDALGTFEAILMLTGGGPGTVTLTPGFYSYSQAFKAFNWRDGATSGWFIVGAVLIVGGSYNWLTRHSRTP